jgi:hypothetical protein
MERFYDLIEGVTIVEENNSVLVLEIEGVGVGYFDKQVENDLLHCYKLYLNKPLTKNPTDFWFEYIPMACKALDINLEQFRYILFLELANNNDSIAW